MDEAHRQYHEVANIFPLMTGAEFDGLKADIAEHGQREPIWLHPDGRIIDGRNRHRACVELGVAPQFKTYAGSDPVAFSLSQNLKRRHLSPDQLGAIGVESLPLLEEETRQRQRAAGAAGAAGAEYGALGGRGNRNPLGARVRQGGFEQDEPKKPEPKKRAPRATDKAGAAVGISGRKVQQIKQIKEKAPDLFEQVKTGELTAAVANREIKRRDAEERRAEILAHYEQPSVWNGLLTPNTISVADIHNLELPNGSVDMVFTDPPYHDEYVDLYGRLAELAAACLKPGGYLLAYVGKMFLPDVLASMRKHLEYVSVFAVFQPFSQSRITKHNLFENWRPIVVFKRPGVTATKAWAQDVVRGTRDKSHHEWQQDTEAPLQYIAAYTEPGDLVLDPFSGGGTTAWACKQLGRYYVAFDIDPSAVALSQERVKSE